MGTLAAKGLTRGLGVGSLLAQMPRWILLIDAKGVICFLYLWVLHFGLIFIFLHQSFLYNLWVS